MSYSPVNPTPEDLSRQYRSRGWLFGLECDQSITIETEHLKIRVAEDEERQFLASNSQHFFAKDPTIWSRCIERFPYIYERTSAWQPITDTRLAIVLSLLSEGEVRIPIHWSVSEITSGASSGSEIIEYMFRVMNGRYHGVPASSMFEVAKEVLPRVEQYLSNSAAFNYGFDPVLIERFYGTKMHHTGYDSSATLTSRAADICMALEYLFSEGSTSEVQFRLGLSVAWLLEQTPERRAAVIKTIKKAYELRSRRVHGARLDSKKTPPVDDVRSVDLLLRRAILARILSNIDDDAWQKLFQSARLGAALEGFDRIQWLT